MSRVIRLVAAAVCGGLLLTGCSASFSVGGMQVSKQELEQKVSEGLTASVGKRPDSVTCPGPVEAEVGKSQRCELTAGGDRLGVTVTVKSVEGKDVKFDIKVDEQPMP
ncbi:DUF4333 domain-containing protein [Saccharopolyspora sp. NPDC000359]|uniref:DUF4333 domain-containing protein n=1 Tax=Saccharopolyspora sp. NPDC000359 TaxID=3154251 RepID=UPI0033261BCC